MLRNLWSGFALLYNCAKAIWFSQMKYEKREMPEPELTSSSITKASSPGNYILCQTGCWKIAKILFNYLPFSADYNSLFKEANKLCYNSNAFFHLFWCALGPARYFYLRDPLEMWQCPFYYPGEPRWETGQLLPLHDYFWEVPKCRPVCVYYCHSAPWSTLSGMRRGLLNSTADLDS